MIHRKDGEFSLPGLKRHRRVISFYLSCDKPCGKLALGQHCIKIISDKSNSVATFLRVQRDIEIKCYVSATFSLKYRSKYPIPLLTILLSP